MTAAKYIVKGINDDQDYCELCGRKDLKKVVWLAAVLEDGSEGGLIHAGCDCAAKLLSQGKSKKESTSAKIVLDRAQVIDKAQYWLQSNHEPKDVVAGLWRVFGYSARPMYKSVVISMGDDQLHVWADRVQNFVPLF